MPISENIKEKVKFLAKAILETQTVGLHGTQLHMHTSTSCLSNAAAKAR